MSPRSVLLGLCATLVVTAPAHAGHRPGPVALGWTYYGLEGGGPYISYHPRAFPSHSKKQVPTYGPIPAAEPTHGHHWVPPAHPGFGYGWLGYRTPSPRPKPATVEVYPPPPVAEEAVVAAPAGACLRVAVKLPDENATVTFGGAAAGGAGVGRVYESPPLTAGQSYTYTITATWAAGGKARTETKAVTGRPGETLTADFTK